MSILTVVGSIMSKGYHVISWTDTSWTVNSWSTENLEFEMFGLELGLEVGGL